MVIVQYESKGDKILTLREYLALIERYFRELINYYKNKGEITINSRNQLYFFKTKF